MNPYRGLLAMTDADADFFFGREQLTADILERLRRGERMLTLVGNSGVGKSSLVQAGVVAALRRQIWPVGGEGRGWPGDLKRQPVVAGADDETGSGAPVRAGPGLRRPMDRADRS